MRKLRKVVDNIIYDSQNAFVGCRQISDAVLVPIECVEGRDHVN